MTPRLPRWALVHADGDKPEAAIAADDSFERRRRIIADWAKFLRRTDADAQRDRPVPHEGIVLGEQSRLVPRREVRLDGVAGGSTQWPRREMLSNSHSPVDEN